MSAADRRTQDLSDVLGQERVEETLLWLCSIASPIGEEEAICDSVQARLSKLPSGSARRYGNSLVVPLTRRRGPKIALVGHLDTVRTENGPARIDGDRCYGSGASDMKSGLAVMIVLAETLDLSDLPCQLTLVFYAREEGPYAENELGEVLRQDPDLAGVDLAVCLEPSDNKLHLGCNGSVHAQITFEGKTGHSARPWEGNNAVTAAAGFLTELAALAPKDVEIDGLVYRTVTTVTQAKDGGRGRNVVPDKFVLNVNHRFAPTGSLEEAMAYLRGLVGDRATVEFTDLSPAAMPSATHPLVQHLMKCGVTHVEPKQAWTDVARFSALGVPAINFGPGENAQAHQKNESTSLPLVRQGYSLLRRWLTTIALGALLFTTGCSSCGKQNEEPSRDPKFDPTSDAAPRPSASAKPAAGMTPAEDRDFRTRLDPELCSEALKRVNTLHQRAPEDSALLNLVSGCLKYGNNAWYQCVLSAKTAEAADTCSRRFLRPPEETK